MNQDQLIGGISQFWDTTVTLEKCTQYIPHLCRDIPKVVEQGDPTGY